MRHPGPGAFALGSPDAPRVLLFHGLTGAPSELWPLGLALEGEGYRVEAPLFPGHGTRPEALVDVDAEQILAAGRAAIRAGSPPVAMAGLSMGALVALALAPEAEPRALTLLAPAAVMAGKSRLFDRLGLVPWRRAMGVLLPKGAPDRGHGLTSAEGDEAAQRALGAQAASGFDGRYDRIPLRWSRELRRMRGFARSAAGRVTAPTLVLHGLDDRTAHPSSAAQVAGWLGRAHVSMRLVSNGRHLLALGPARGVVASEVVRFLHRVSDGSVTRAGTG